MRPTKFRFVWPSRFRGKYFLEINQSETRIACGDHVSNRIGTKWAIFIEDLPRMLPTKFRFIWSSGFREEDFFLNRPIRNKNCLWRHVCKWIGIKWKMFIEDLSVHLAKEFQRSRLKCEKLTDDGRQVMVKAHILILKLNLLRWFARQCVLSQNYWFEVRGGCLFCFWYWWNCWPSPFKWSFHNIRWLDLIVKRNGKAQASVLDTPLCHKVCQWIAVGRWFSPGTPVSSTNRTAHHDITEILLKVALNIIALTLTLAR